MLRKVLIIEDNLELQEIYKIDFKSENFIVEFSNDWLDGIIKILDLQPDIIILDIMMPEMNGFDVLKTIRDQSSINIPIIVCSNLNSLEDEKKALRLGADIYLRKSDVEWNEIVQKALKLLNK